MTTRERTRLTAAIRRAADKAERNDDGLHLFCLLKKVCDQLDSLGIASRQIIADWDSVDELAQVPDEINVDRHWNDLRSSANDPVRP